MKNFFGLMGILGFVVVASVGCGSSNSTPGNAVGYKTKDQGGVTGKECSQQLETDAEAIAQAINKVQANPTLDGLNQLKTQVQAFKTKYDGVSCTSTDQNGKTITFDVTAESNKILDQINKAIQAVNGGGNPGGLNNGLQGDALESSFTGLSSAFGRF